MDKAINSANETSEKNKARDFLRNPQKYVSDRSIFKTFAILAANSTDTKGFDGKSDNEEIMSSEAPESILKRFHFKYYKVKCKYGNAEDSFLIYNLTRRDAESLSTRFEQQSFIFGKNDENGLTFEFWANKLKSGYVYSKADERIIQNDVTDAGDCYTQILRDFKINFPFEKFEFDDEEMIENYYNKYNTSKIYRENFENNLKSSLDESITFMGRVTARGRL